MTPTYSFSEISEEASFLHKEILLEADKDLEIRSLYKGCQVLFSPVIIRPKILLIGFNPGGGYYSWHGRIVEEFQPLKALEYYLNKHPLGEQTKSLFHQAERKDDLQHYTMKANFYYWATDNVADFNRLMKLLPAELSGKIFHQARVWTKQLVKALKPEMIIAEGFKAFEEVEVLFPEKQQIENTEFYRSFVTPEGFKILGYKRNQGSIVGKNDIAISLKLQI